VSRPPHALSYNQKGDYEEGMSKYGWGYTGGGTTFSLTQTLYRGGAVVQLMKIEPWGKIEDKGRKSQFEENSNAWKGC